MNFRPRKNEDVKYFLADKNQLHPFFFSDKVEEENIAKFYILTNDAQPIATIGGFNAIKSNENSFFEILSLFVLEPYRRQDYGTKIFQRLAKLKQSENLSMLKALVTKDNLIALQFYQAIKCDIELYEGNYHITFNLH